MRRAGFLVALSLLLMPAAALAQHDDHSMAALKEMTPNFQAAYNAGDVKAVAAMYAEDGALHPPNSAPVDGRAAIATFWAAGLESGPTAELTTKTLVGMGDNAAEVGMYVITGSDGSHLDHGHYTLIYKKVDGKWLILSDMWNSDMSQ